MSDILGWLPNLLAAFGFMAISIVIINLVENITEKSVPKKYKILTLLFFTITGLTGFILHEITQKKYRSDL